MYPYYITSLLLVTLKLLQSKTWTKEKLQRVMTSHGVRVKVQRLDYQMHFTNGFLWGEKTAVSS